MLYGWTPDYVLDSLTMEQLLFYHREGAIFQNPDLDDKPEKGRLKRAHYRSKKAARTKGS